MGSVKRWIQTLMAVGLVGLGLLITLILGLRAYMNATATPFHPNPEDVPSVTHSAPSPKWADAVERGRHIMLDGLTGRNLPGLSVAVGVDDEIAWAEGFGWADLENRIEVAPNTRFPIGMASKVLTSAAVGLLVDQGRLTLDEEIQTYVPAYPRKQGPVTLRQLMGHLAGVRTDGGDEGLPRVHCDRAVDGLQLFAQRSLWFEPGTGYRYSNYGWILVSAAVEDAGNESFFRFMQTNIFEPLGMNDTKADSVTDPPPDRAKFYFPRFAADPRYGEDGVRHVDYSCFAGSGGFASTPSDLVRFGMAMNRSELLKPSTIQMLQASQRLPTGEETGYGLGWDLETVELTAAQTPVVGHDGEVMGGMVVSFMTFPEHGIVIAVASNIAYAGTFSLAVDVAQAFVEQERDPES